tara:strand:- start:162 stop:608 length:447 start_codon:yes stop_codon:yes gene_type:complete
MKYTITNKDTGRLLQVDSKEKLDEIIFATRHLTGINIDVNEDRYEIKEAEQTPEEVGNLGGYVGAATLLPGRTDWEDDNALLLQYQGERAAHVEALDSVAMRLFGNQDWGYIYDKGWQKNTKTVVYFMHEDTRTGDISTSEEYEENEE